MILKHYTFQNCTSAVEDLFDPKDGELAGRAFVVIDQESGEVWKFPMPLDVAKLQGQRLMGIGSVEVANQNGLKRELSRHERRDQN